VEAALSPARFLRRRCALTRPFHPVHPTAPGDIWCPPNLAKGRAICGCLLCSITSPVSSSCLPLLRVKTRQWWSAMKLVMTTL
jgi:hypothetical protein